MSETNQDARHPATQTRLLQAQRDGQIARSQELASAVHLIFSLGIVYLTIRSISSRFGDFTSKLWSTTQIYSPTLDEFNSQTANALFESAILILPLLLAIGLISIASHLVQNPALAMRSQGPFNLKSLNPIVGLQRLLSIENQFRSILGLPKIAILGVVFALTIWHWRLEFANLSFQGVEKSVSGMVDCIFYVLFSCASVLLVTAAADYLMERFSTARRLRMSDQELRDENRLQQIDPQVASRRQQIFQELLQGNSSASGSNQI